MTKSFTVALAITYLFLASCFMRVNPQTTVRGNNKEGAANMEATIQSYENDEKINLRHYDKATNKQNIDIFLEQTPEYPVNCTMADFIPRQKYAGFELTEILHPEYNSIRVWYSLESNKKKMRENDATVKLTFFQSRAESHEFMRRSLNNRNMTVYVSDLKIGDFDIGNIYNVDFIRGNMGVNVSGRYLGKQSSIRIGDLALEIDRHILDILERYRIYINVHGRAFPVEKAEKYNLIIPGTAFNVDFDD